MTYKSDVGLMEYGEGANPQGGNFRPHAVTSLIGPAGTVSISYDENGNMTQKGASTFTYDIENRLTKITSSSSTTQFFYDGDGGRLKKLTVDSGQVTVYIGSIYEVDSEGIATKHIFAGSNRICSLKSEGTALYYHTDHLGSSNVLTDGSGSKLAQYEYSPYGKTSKQTGQDLATHKFTGKELDATGLYYYGARYYDPELGRFISADPTVQHPNDPQDLNRYAYCRNNPINYVDPTGYGWFEKFWKNAGSLFGVIGGIIKGVVTGDWSTVRNQVTSFAAAFIFSAGNIVTATAAFMATSILETYPGKKLTKIVGQEIFDDAFGMRPKAAYMWSSVVLHTTLSLTFEHVYANMVAEPIGEGAPFNPDNPDETELFNNPKGYDTGGRTVGGSERGFNDPTKLQTFRNKTTNSLTVVGKDAAHPTLFAKVPSPPIHTSAISSSFPSSGTKSLAGAGYGKFFWFGSCQQVTNATLLSSGISSTMAQVYPSWSTFTTTAIYGNYGGGLPTKAAVGWQAYENY